ncbi:glia maturation factor beta [Echinococcus multilocularis]|uniref:Glia maturation factor beta n=1 Tax=Echinococcus multilocularis TaxID=6211 RepID=A0A068Y7N6_ECHMU|nr:glia maturation factor beta [Echinococcus multilocularis]
MTTTLASIPEELTKKYRSFKFRKTKGSRAIINKINVTSRAVEIEQEIDDLSFDDLPNELCQSEPRYILVSYEFHHDDGRVSYPYCLIFSSPRGSSSNLKMLYAGSLRHFADASQVTRVYELQDVEDFTEDWLRAEIKLKQY